MTLTFLIGSLLFTTTLSAQGWRTVTNERAHYRVSFPSTWTVWDVDPSGALSATSYPKNRAIEGGLVPGQEAAITIFMNGGESGTIEMWIDESLKHVEEIRRNKVSLQSGQHGDVDSYIEVESRYDTGPEVYYRRVTAYYALKGRLLAAQLEFREGASREGSYRSVLDGVIRSIVEQK